MYSLPPKSDFYKTLPQLDISRHWRQAIGILDKRGGKFVCLRRNSKGSGLPTGWNKPENLKSGKEALRHLDAGGNVGLAAGTGNLYIIDFDGEADRGHECAHLAGGLYFYRANAPHKAKFVFTCPDKIPTRNKSQQYGIDLLGINSNDTHWQGVIAGVHQSGAPTLWGGHTVPELPVETMAALWEEWTGEELFPTYQGYNCNVNATYTNADMARVAAALQHIDALAIEYVQWIGIIAAIKSAFGDEALPMVAEWGDEQPGQVAAKWKTFNSEYSGRPVTLLSVFYLARQGGWVEPAPEPAPLPEGAQVLPNGAIILKTTPAPEPKPRPPLPACTLEAGAALRQTLNSPEGRALLHALSVRTREVYVAALAVLLTYAGRHGSWAFDLNTRDLGVLLGKTGMSASRNLHALDRVGLVNYRHGTAQTEVGDAPPMRLDLSPIIANLLDVTGVSDGDDLHADDGSNVTDYPYPYTCNVYAQFSGGGEFADATMRANPITKGLHGRTLRGLSASALNGLDLVAHGELALTRRQLVDELGMSPGSAAGATRVYVELGIATVEKIGRSHEYVFSPDWQAQLEAMVPQMVSFLASDRLKIRNVSDRIVEVERHIRRLGGDPKQPREDDSPPVRELHTRRKKMLFARKQLIAAMEVKDLASRPQAAPQPKCDPSATQVPPVRTVKRSTPHRVSEGDLIERRLALYAAARESRVAA